MGQSDGGYAPCYNVEISTDAHEKAIIALSISQSPADQTLLGSAIDEIEKTTKRLPEKLVVDAGFTTRDAILAVEEKRIDLIGSFPDAAAGRITLLRKQGIVESFYPERFLFDPERTVHLPHRERSVRQCIHRKDGNRRSKSNLSATGRSG
jgi:hypothetical protein